MAKSPASPPASINPGLRVHQPAARPLAYYVDGIRRSDRVVLGQAITLVESTLAADRRLAEALVEACLPHSGRSLRLGITGVPGVGKSTFIEALGLHLLQAGRRLAVLAVDPSSQLSRGSILGDKTRMSQLAAQPAAFIRPSPAGLSLGGVALHTREVMLLCEAAGYDTLIIETVGVGQSETAVHDLTDVFLLLLLPGAGDELQGIKRGIVEMADLLAVNKADGERAQAARRAQADYRQALHLFPPHPSGWTPEVLTCSATSGTGIAEIWTAVENYRALTEKNGYFEEQRRQQALDWMYDSVRENLLTDFYRHPTVSTLRHSLEEAVRQGQVSPGRAAHQLLESYRRDQG